MESPYHQCVILGHCSSVILDTMNLVIVAALIAACGAAKLDRTYLPPQSSALAGGSSEFLQAPFARASESQSVQLPSGGYENEDQGIVVDAAAPGTRASNQPTGLGGPRVSYGFTDSKVGDAAFRGTKNPPSSQPSDGRPNQAFQEQFGTFKPQESVHVNLDNVDLSAFHQPPVSFRPAPQLFTDRVSNTIKYHNNIGINRFNYGFETENGIKMEETGVSDDGVKAQGGYSYTGDDGKVYSVVYTADENGYRPQGAHLPTPPPIPVEILQSLAQNAKDEAAGLNEGSYDEPNYNGDDYYTKSDANGKYNDRQSNKFGEQPGSDSNTVDTVFNQNKHLFAQPNNQGQFSSFDSSKDLSSSAPDSHLGTSSNGLINNVNKVSTVVQNGQNGQFVNRFGSQFQYSPPVENSQNVNAFPDIHSSYDRNVNTQPLSQQNLQGQKPFTTFIKPSSYDIPIFGQGSSNTKQSAPDQSANNNRVFNKTPFQQAITQNVNIPGGITSFQNNKAQTFSNFETKPSENINNNKPQHSISFSQFIKPHDSKVENQNQDQNRPSFSFSQQGILPTKQPQLTLTTPFEDRGQSINTQSKFSPQSSSSMLNKEPLSQTISEEHQRFDNSYIYNKPLQPFMSPSSQPDFSNFPTLPSGLFNRVTEQSSISQSPSFANAPEDSVISTQYQGLIGSSKYPSSSTLPPITPTLATSKDNEEKNIYQTNGVTHASISSFPSIIPTSSSNIKQPFQQNTQFNIQNTAESSQAAPTTTSATAQVYFSGSDSNNQKYNAADLSQSQQGPFITKNKSQDSFIQSQTLQNNGEIYEYNKPVQALVENTKSSSQKPDTKYSQGNVQSNPKLEHTTPPRFGVQTNTLFGPQPTQSQLDIQTGSFGQKTTSSQFGLQTSSSFGQQTTPSRLGVQTSPSFEQQLIQSQLDVQPSSSSGQKTTSSGFSGQTNLSLGQEKVQSPIKTPTSSSLGQLTSISRFDVQTSSTFGQKIAPSQFGPQIGSSFGQKATPPRFNIQAGLIFGQPSLPSRFGAQDQTSSLFGQSISTNQQKIPSQVGKQTNPSLGYQSSSSFGQQTKIPTRFGEQTGSVFQQKVTPSPFRLQTSSSFGQQTSLSPSSIQITSFKKQNISSPFNVQIPQFGIQTNKQTGQEIVSQKDKNVGQDQRTPFQEPNKQSEFQVYTKPSISLPNTASSQNDTNQDLTQISGAGEVYEYNKPTASLTTGNENDSQSNSSPQKFSIDGQSGQQRLTGSQIEDNITPTQESSFTQFGQEGFSDSQKNNIRPIGFQNQQTINFGSHGTLTQHNFLTPSKNTAQSSRPIPISPTQSLLDIQNQDKVTQAGEIYQYNKPSQMLPDHAQKENCNAFGNKKDQSQFTAQNTFGSIKPVTSSENNEKNSNTNLQTQNSHESQLQNGFRIQKPTAQFDNKPQTSIDRGTPSLKPFGALSFQSACCRGSQLDTLTSKFRGPVPKKNYNQGSNISNPKESEFSHKDSTGSILNSGGQKGITPSLTGKGEQFGGARKPPSFDATGYHY